MKEFIKIKYTFQMFMNIMNFITYIWPFVTIVFNNALNQYDYP